MTPTWVSAKIYAWKETLSWEETVTTTVTIYENKTLHKYKSLLTIIYEMIISES